MFLVSYQCVILWLGFTVGKTNGFGKIKWPLLEPWEWIFFPSRAGRTKACQLQIHFGVAPSLPLIGEVEKILKTELNTLNKVEKYKPQLVLDEYVVTYSPELHHFVTRHLLVWESQNQDHLQCTGVRKWNVYNLKKKNKALSLILGMLTTFNNQLELQQNFLRSLWLHKVLNV